MARHTYDRNPTPQHPVVRLYPAIPWLGTYPCWVRDDGQDTMDQNVITYLFDEKIRGDDHIGEHRCWIGDSGDVINGECKGKPHMGWWGDIGNYALWRADGTKVTPVDFKVSR